MYQAIKKLNVYLRGWVSYFRIQEFRMIFRDLDGWIRSRLRSMQLKKWKNPRKFQRMMIRAGFKPQQAHRVWVKMNKWQSVERREVRFVMDLKWFRKQGLIFLHDFTQRQQPLELTFSRWSRSGLPGRYEPFCREGVVVWLLPTRLKRHSILTWHQAFPIKFDWMCMRRIQNIKKN